MAGRELKISILGEDKGASKALKGVGDATDQLGGSSEKAGGIVGKLRDVLADKLGPAGDSARSAVDGLSDGLKVGLVAGAGAAATGLLALGKMALGVIDEVDNLQDIVGGTAEEASRLRNIAHVTGVDVETLGSSLFKLSINVDKSRETFKKWGVNLATNEDGTFDYLQTLLNLSDAYNAIEDPQQRNVFLMQTIGKSGKDLIDILEMGSEALKKFGESGPIVSDRDIERAKEFNQNIEKIKLTAQGFGLSMARAFFDPLGPSDQFTRSLAKAGDKTAIAKDKANQLAAQQKDLGDKFKKTAEQIDLETQALDDLKSAQEKLLGVERSLTDAHEGAADAARTLDKRTREVAGAVAEHGENSQEARDAVLDLHDAERSQVDAIVSLADVLRDQRVAQLEANGEVVTGAQKTDLFRQALIQMADTVKDPARSEILKLAGNIKDDLPNEKRIDITADTSQAHAAVASLAARINEIRAADITVTASTAFHEASLDRYQSGGWVTAPHGQPQLAVVHGGEYVIPADVAKHISKGGMTATTSAGGGTVYLLPIAINIDGKKVAETTARFTVNELRRRGAI